MITVCWEKKCHFNGQHVFKSLLHEDELAQFEIHKLRQHICSGAQKKEKIYEGMATKEKRKCEEHQGTRCEK